MPRSSLKNTQIVTERIRKKVEDAYYNYPELLKRQITISEGVVSFKESEITAFSVFKIADKLMYEAKRGGKNKIYIMKELFKEE